MVTRPRQTPLLFVRSVVELYAPNFKLTALGFSHFLGSRPPESLAKSYAGVSSLGEAKSVRGGEERRGFATWGADAVPFVVGTQVARDRDSSHVYRGDSGKEKAESKCSSGKRKGRQL